MQDVYLTTNQFNANGYWQNPILNPNIPLHDTLSLFDQNGYDLTELERIFAQSNFASTKSHRSHRTAIKHTWFGQYPKNEGAILNHSLLFERKAYSGSALAQLKSWAEINPRVNQLIALQPKWGLDFSMDYVDRQGNAFEVLHWEYDSFDYNEIQEVKQQAEQILDKIDWNYSAKQILQRKDEWHHLDFFQQSNWKCNYFGIRPERFKMVAWA